MNLESAIGIADIIFSDLSAQKLDKALEDMGSLLAEFPDWSMQKELEQISQSYDGLLGCLRMGYEDSGRKKNFLDMVRRSYILAFRLHRLILRSLGNEFRKAESLIENDILIGDLTGRMERRQEEMFKYEASISDSIGDLQELSTAQENDADMLFRLIWTSSFWNESQEKEALAFFYSPLIGIEPKMLEVSALLLSLSILADERKMRVLLQVAKADEERLRNRAFSAFVASYVRFDKYYAISSDLGQRLRKKSKDKAWQIRLARNLRDFHIAQSIPDDSRFFEKVMKPRMMRSLQGKLSDIASIPQDGELGRIARMEALGHDFNFFTFTAAKHFPYFKNASAWLKPFTSYHPDTIRTMAGGDKQRSMLLDLLYKMDQFCDSDMWSLYFLSPAMPIYVNGKDLTKEESAELKQQLKDKVHKSNRHDNLHYLQDLYRFFHLYDNRKEFFDIFSLSFSPEEHPFILECITDGEAVAILLKALAENRLSDDVIYLAGKIISGTIKADMDTYDVILLYGIALESQGKLEEAARSYEKAALIREDSRILERMADCLMKAKDFHGAIKACMRLEAVSPGNLEYLERKGICQEALNEYEEAIETFFEMEYLGDDVQQEKARHHIIKCAFHLERTDNVISYAGKLRQNGLSDEEMCMAAFAYWEKGESDLAYRYYSEACQKAQSTDRFMMLYDKYRYRSSAGNISAVDAQIMLEAILRKS